MGARVSSGTGSTQTYATPTDFMEAVCKRFGAPVFDLAASVGNAKASSYFTENANALAEDWTKCGDGPLWLNPPFKTIEPWARKCAAESERGAEILFLVPVSISDWYVRHVARNSDTYFLHGRLSFDGIAPYPKDCMLCHFYKSLTHRAIIWSWRDHQSFGL